MVKKSKPKRVWMRVPSKPKFDSMAKSGILAQIHNIVDCTEKLKHKLHRIDMRGNKIYLYELFEPFFFEGGEFIKPLIDGKYCEDVYARISVFDAKLTECTADWQRHTGQWISLYEGTLQECLMRIEENDWFR